MSGIKKPSIKKPVNGIKKPAVKPAVKPVAPKAVEVPVELEVVEEKVIEIPVIVDEVSGIAPELLEQMEKEQNAVEDDIKTPPELIHEEKVEEPVVVEEVKEEKPKAKKSSKKSKAKKEEPKEEPVVEDDLETISLNDAIEKLSGTFDYTVPEWEEAKQEIEDRLKSTTIDPDADPGVMRMLIAELDEFISELRLVRTNTNDKVKAITERVEYIRLSHSVGTNSEERKANGYKALMNYRLDPSDTEAINLIEYKLFFESQLNFYNETIETLKDRKQLLITFSSMMKIESTF